MSVLKAESLKNQFLNQNANLNEVIKVVPEKYIVFQCQDDQPMGQIRIAIICDKNGKQNESNLYFQLMCTNKQNYKVSNCKGILDRTSSNLIRIYIKNIDNLEKCLSDKFRIRVFQQNSPNEPVYLAKLKVLIEKHKPSAKVDELSSNINQTSSRTASLYTNPSVYINPSVLSSTAASDIRSIANYSRFLTNQQKKSTPLQQKQQSLNDFKELLDESNQKYYNKQKQLKTAENNYQKNKAKQKFCFGLLIIVFILSVLFGLFLKWLSKREMFLNISDYIKTKYFN